MRLMALSISAIVILCSCNNGSSTKEISDTTTTTTTATPSRSEPVAPKVDRQTLIAEIRGLKEVFASKDKDKIAELFQFPIADTIGIPVWEDSYFKEYKANGDKTTRDMFNRYFPQIAETTLIDDINFLFKHIQHDSLQKTDTLETDSYQKTQPCFRSYQVTIENETVTLRIDMQSNREWVDPNPKEDEVADNFSEICEHSLWWIFKYDGKKLNLFQISGLD